jgi:hypothetical protein
LPQSDKLTLSFPESGCKMKKLKDQKGKFKAWM